MKNGYASYLGIDFSFALLEINKLKKSEKNNQELLNALEYVESKVLMAYKTVKYNSQDMPKEYEESYAINRAIMGINLTFDSALYSDKTEKYNQELFDMVLDVLNEKKENIKKGSK